MMDMIKLLSLFLIFIHKTYGVWEETSQLNSILTDLKTLFPKTGIMNSIIEEQEGLIEIVATKEYLSPEYGRRRYGRYSSYDSYLDNQDQFHNANDKNNWNINLDIHTDIVFIGFPTSTVDVLRNKWFDSLGRKDSVLYSLNSEILKLNENDCSITHHYHLVQTSAMVSDVIRDRINQLSKKIIDNKVNLWEIEDILISLAETVTSTHTVTISDTVDGIKVDSPAPTKPVMTIFMFNNINDVKIQYINGFEDEIIQTLSTNEEITKLVNLIAKKQTYLASSETSDSKLIQPIHTTIETILNDFLNQTNEKESFFSKSSGHFQRDVLHLENELLTIRQRYNELAEYADTLKYESIGER